jgi:hypothetical protein
MWRIVSRFGARFTAFSSDRLTILDRMRNDRLLTAAAVVLGVVLIAIAVVYWAEPARSLPSFFPGHAAGSSHHHTKHGIAAFLLGLACFVFAWFRTGPSRSGPKRTPAA